MEKEASFKEFKYREMYEVHNDCGIAHGWQIA